MMSPKRIQLRRTKGWRMPENTVKVDRSTRYGNPYLIERQGGQLWEPDQGTWRGNLHSVRLLGGPYWYRAYLTRAEAASLACRQFAASIAPSMDVEKLRGKNLACWCRLCERHADGKPLDEDCPDCDPCHVDPLGKLANHG